MIKRILILSAYFLRRLFFSLAGIIYIILALIYWILLFSPGQGTPDIEYYTLVIGAFGAGLTFLTALTIAARANRAAYYPLVVRLPSRIEYLAAVLFGTLLFAFILQLLVAVLALIRGPELALGRVIEIPPLWMATNILSAILALHASDFVMSNWSRVYLFGALAILLFGKSGGETAGNWLASQVASLTRFFIGMGWIDLGTSMSRFSNWLTGGGSGKLSDIFGFVFWPFQAMSDAVVRGVFEPTQALAPAIILLYATILFMLAADLFATKDLDFME